MPEHILKVDEENNHTRLDVFLAKNLSEIPSRTFIQKLIEAGEVTVNQKKVKAGYKVAHGDEVLVLLPEHEELFENI